jgi:hypothetical protein
VRDDRDGDAERQVFELLLAKRGLAVDRGGTHADDICGGVVKVRENNKTCTNTKHLRRGDADLIPEAVMLLRQSKREEQGDDSL